MQGQARGAGLPKKVSARCQDGDNVTKSITDHLLGTGMGERGERREQEERGEWRRTM